MLSYQGFFLAVTSISVVLADILVQPNYEHQYKNPQYLQHHSLLQYPTQPQTEQYHIKQSPNEQTIPYLPKVQSVQTVYPYYKSYQDKALVALRPPYHHLYHHHYWLPKPNHFHYAKIGGHGYMRPSVFVGYPQPSIVHYQHTRSRRSTPTDIESSKSAIVANDNDVATKSPLIDTKHLTDIDSLLPKHEPTDTNDKHVKNRQTDDRPSGLLLGLYPENMYRSPPTESTIKEKDKMQHPPLTSSPISSSTPKYPNEKAPTQLTPIQPTLETVFQGNGQNYEASRINHDESHFTHNEPYTKFEPFSNPIPIVFQARSLNEEPASQIAYDKYYNNYDGTYEDAVDESTRQFNRYEYLPKYDSVYEELMPQVILQKHARNYQQAIYPELEKKTLQKITNMDVTNTAEPRQDKFTIHIPSIPNNSEKSLGTNDAPVTTTFVQPLDPFVHNQYKNNEQLSGTDETDILFDIDHKFVPKQPYYYSVNNDLDYDSDDYSDEYLDDEDLDNDLYERTSYSAHLKPVIVTDYVLYTNISPRSNALTTPKIQFLDLPEKKIRNTLPSSTCYYNPYGFTTSSHVFY